jgi:hypothetical protein
MESSTENTEGHRKEKRKTTEDTENTEGKRELNTDRSASDGNHRAPRLLPLALWTVNERVFLRWFRLFSLLLSVFSVPSVENPLSGN